MWIVRAALRNPYTVGVLAFFLTLMGILSLKSMRIDIFPTIDIPVVGIVWTYTGISAEEMERRIVFPAERGYTTTVNGISKIESKSIPGIGLVRIYFAPGTDIGAAIAEISAVSETVLRILPPGIQPPTILQFNASNVPVAQMTIQSDTIPEEKLFDYAQNFVRLRLFTIPGLATPAPYGGKSRQINVDIIPARIAAKGLSPLNVVQAINNSNLIIPAGTARIGSFEYNVILNSSPVSVSAFKDIPIKVVAGRPVTLGEVANITDSYADQTNIVRLNGVRATYLNILKKADASTLDVVNATRASIPLIKLDAPADMKFRIDFDQSSFVRASIYSVLREAIIAAVLVSAMILIFLGSWQSVIIVCTSIPLSIFASIIGLKLLGSSINIMTLGGLSLAIGMLVDDATVEVENIHRNREHAPSLVMAILRGANQIALPAIMSTLAICIVFFPITLLEGPAKFLFTPMGLSVVFAMLASYVLSRTLVPTLSQMLMGDHDHHQPKWIEWISKYREIYFGKLQEKYSALLDTFMAQRKTVLIIFGLILAVSFTLPFLVVGTDFFPSTDAGLMKLHFRARPGTRIEETEKLIEQAENRIRKIIPEDELETLNSMIGIPTSYNLAFVSTDNIGSMDAEILIALKEDHHPTINYMKAIRTDLEKSLPGSQVYFQPADIINQVLNFGVSAPIDVQIEFQKIDNAIPIARNLRDKLKLVPGIVDVNITQVFDYPTLRVNVDRIKAAQLGITQQDVASSLLISLASSSLIAPNFYLNPENNVSYSVVTKVPLLKMSSVNDLMLTPITSGAGVLLNNEGASPTALSGDLPSAQSQTLGNLAGISTSAVLNEVSHLNVQRILDITAGVEERDLGATVKDIQKSIKSLGALPKGIRIFVRGQNEVMNESFKALGLGMILAVILVFMLMVVLFQSWIDPFIILTAVVGALIGILWILALTGTTLNVVSLMGSIMAVGIAVSNSILLVSFANDIRIEKKMDAHEAAIEAGKTRLRPVLMTALAMVLGMIPMALGLGEGGEQNAPLGRAVIGGLLMATLTTLLLVPVVYSLLRKALPAKQMIRAKIYKDEMTFEEEEKKLLEAQL